MVGLSCKEFVYFGFMSNAPLPCREAGFTLVELAIVLVIIGLIIGGVLVGQDMIKSAEIRATVSQWEKYNAAVNVFRDKYGGLPGDLNANRAAQFGFAPRSGATHHGDGNGLLYPCDSDLIIYMVGCETTLFWRDLNTASLIDGYFQIADDAYSVGGAEILTDMLPDVFPSASVGRGNYFFVFGSTGKNWFQISGATYFDDTGAANNFVLALSPFEAYNIDRKTDDGRPATGGTRAMAELSLLNVPAIAGAAMSGATCVAADGTYNQTTEANANTPACQLRLRMN